MIETIARSAVDNLLDNCGQCAMDWHAVHDMGRAVDHSHTEGIILSRNSVRSVETNATLGQTVVMPVISSNQAMMFQSLQLAGIGDAVTGFGQLLEWKRL